MNEIHLINIDYIEQNTEDIPFKYKPDVPKLKVYGELLVAETEEEVKGIVFLTQKQLNQIIGGKGIDLVVDDEKNRWYIRHPLNQDQIKKVGLVNINAEYVGHAGERKCYEVLEVKN